MSDVYEIAHVLTEQYNAYAGMTEDFPLLEEAWVAECLSSGAFDTGDIELLLDDDFARGMIMGQVRFLYTLEQDDEGTDEQT